MLEIALKECAELRASLIKRCQTYEDELAVASAFVEQAAEIWKEPGGNKHVAAQFYALAEDFEEE